MLKLTYSYSVVLSQVLQKLGKTMETKDEQFELCFQNLNKQQVHHASTLPFQHKKVSSHGSPSLFAPRLK